jgi:hypothetical protein
MTLTFPQAADKLNRTGTLLPKATVDALRQAGKVSADIANVTGGRMRNMGRNGVNLTATARIGNIEAVVRPRQPGPWRIAESGAGPHLIGISRRATKRGRRRTGFVYAAGYSHPVRGPIAHPGAKGRRVWTRTVDRAEQVVPPVFKRTVIAKSLKAVF